MEAVYHLKGVTSQCKRGHQEEIWQRGILLMRGMAQAIFGRRQESFRNKR
jgi:hypothetical protein